MDVQNSTEMNLDWCTNFSISEKFILSYFQIQVKQLNDELDNTS